SEQVEPVADPIRADAVGLAQHFAGSQMTCAPEAPWVDADDQQVSARADTARGFTQDRMGRETEIQTVLDHHHVGSMFGQRPALFFADDLYAWHRRAQANAALDLLRFD